MTIKTNLVRSTAAVDNVCYFLRDDSLQRNVVLEKGTLITFQSEEKFCMKHCAFQLWRILPAWAHRLPLQILGKSQKRYHLLK